MDRLGCNISIIRNFIYVYQSSPQAYYHIINNNHNLSKRVWELHHTGFKSVFLPYSSLTQISHPSRATSIVPLEKKMAFQGWGMSGEMWLWGWICKYVKGGGGMVMQKSGWDLPTSGGHCWVGTPRNRIPKIKKQLYGASTFPQMGELKLFSPPSILTWLLTGQARISQETFLVSCFCTRKGQLFGQLWVSGTFVITVKIFLMYQNWCTKTPLRWRVSGALLSFTVQQSAPFARSLAPKGEVNDRVLSEVPIDYRKNMNDSEQKSTLTSPLLNFIYLLAINWYCLENNMVTTSHVWLLGFKFFFHLNFS